MKKTLRKRLRLGGPPEERTQWEGHPEAETSWQPAEVFASCVGLLAEFEQGAVAPAAVGRGIKRDDARHAEFSRFLDGGIFLSCGRTKC